MELDKFVEMTLTSIFDGAARAASHAKKQGGAVNPNAGTDDRGALFARPGGYKRLCIAEFDVALSVGDKKNQGGKLGVVLGSVGIGGGVSTAEESAQITRVKFSVPYMLP